MWYVYLIFQFSRIPTISAICISVSPGPFPRILFAVVSVGLLAFSTQVHLLKIVYNISKNILSMYNHGNKKETYAFAEKTNFNYFYMYVYNIIFFSDFHTS